MMRGRPCRDNCRRMADEEQMEYTYNKLKHTKMSDLRDLAAGLDHDAVKGYTQLNKDHLLKALCTALGVEIHEHHDVVGVDKSGVKAQIRELKTQRDEFIKAHDHKELKRVRREIHLLKRTIRKATV